MISIIPSCSCKVSNVERVVQGDVRILDVSYKVLHRRGGSSQRLRFRVVK